MSKRSHTKIWLHIVWGTKGRENLLPDEEHRKKVSDYLYNYAEQKEIYMKKNYVNADHVHVLIDMPADRTVAETAQLLKGSSSNWINKQEFMRAKFAWSTGYAAFSVSDARVSKVVQYIDNQDEHHRTKSFREEWTEFLTAHGSEKPISER